MSNHDSTMAGLENQAFALMGRMHVILRRQSGRVTDIEYMRIDPAYCRYLLSMASSMDNEDLQQICGKLQEIYFGPEGLFVRSPPKPPLLARFGEAQAKKGAQPVAATENTIAASESAAATAADHGAIVDQSYIGRLR